MLLTPGCLYFQNSTESYFGKQPIGINSSKMTVLSTQLHSGTVYVFTLTVHKAGKRPASVNQTVSITHNLTPFSRKSMFFLVSAFQLRKAIWSHVEYHLQINCFADLRNYGRTYHRNPNKFIQRRLLSLLSLGDCVRSSCASCDCGMCVQFCVVLPSLH